MNSGTWTMTSGHPWCFTQTALNSDIAAFAVPFHKGRTIWRAVFKALADVPSRTCKSICQCIWSNRKQRGYMPGRGGSGSGNVTLSGQTVLLHVSLLHAATYGLTLLAVDAPRYGVVGTASAFPVPPAHVRSRFHRPPLPLVPRVQAVVFPHGD